MVSTRSAENIGERFETLALTQPSAPALLVPRRGAFDYRELHGAIASMGAQLERWGCARGDVVAGLITDRLTMALACITVPVHATFAPLAPELTYGACRRLLQRLRPKIVLLACEAAHPVRRAVIALGLAHVELALREGRLHGTPVPARPSIECRPDRAVPRDARWAYLLSGSGSSGESKLIPITHDSMYRNAGVLAERLGLCTHDVGCHLIPMHLPQGLRVALMVPLMCGSAVVIADANDAGGFFAGLEEFGITWVTAGFTLVRHLAERSEEVAARMAGSRLRFIRCGSGTLPPESIRFVEERLGAPIIAAYSTVEAGAISIDPLPPRMRKPGGVGVPVHDGVRIIDDAGKLCARGELGEIAVRGPMVFDGYFDDPTRTRQAFLGDWYRTGDLGRFDDDGFLFIEGRIADVINRGGEKILPLEVDAALERVRGVKEAAAFALPHPTLGEELVAAVVCADDAERSAAAIRSQLFATLGRRGTPRSVFFVDTLPRTGNGKIKRFELARQFRHVARDGFATPAPRSALAAALQAMWAALLSLDHVGADDDFFMLGGDSLSGARLLVQVERVFGAALAVDSLFGECATVNGMARAIEALQVGDTAGAR